MNARAFFLQFRPVIHSFDFLLRHERILRRFAREEQTRGVCSNWLSRAIESLDEPESFNEISAPK